MKKKPTFTTDQLVTATHVVQNFKEVKQKASQYPVLIQDAENYVLLNYQDYEVLYMAFEELKELKLQLENGSKIKKVDEQKEIIINSDSVSKDEDEEVNIFAEISVNDIR